MLDGHLQSITGRYKRRPYYRLAVLFFVILYIGLLAIGMAVKRHNASEILPFLPIIGLIVLLSLASHFISPEYPDLRISNEYLEVKILWFFAKVPWSSISVTAIKHHDFEVLPYSLYIHSNLLPFIYRPIHREWNPREGMSEEQYHSSRRQHQQF